MSLFGVARFAHFLAPAAGFLLHIHSTTKVKPCIFCAPTNVDQPNEYHGLNKSLYRIETAHIKHKAQAKSQMWDFFNRQVTSFIG